MTTASSANGHAASALDGRSLLVNADGYGFTEGINRGIEEAIDAGIVRSISVNANFDAVWELRGLVERHPEISVGVHLNPVVGRPIAPAEDVPTLVGANGELHFGEFTPRLQAGRIDRAELVHELGLQIERVKSLVPSVTHLDSHQNRHLWPRFFEVFLELAQQHGIERMRTHVHRIGTGEPARIARVAAFYARNPQRLGTHGFARYLMWRARRRGLRMCQRLLAVGAGTQASQKGVLDAWLRLIEGCPRGTNEVYCHPAYVDDDLRRYAKVIVDQRDAERRVLTDQRLADAVERHGVRLITFHEI